MKLEDLIDIEEIKQMKARYFRGIDTNDWGLLGDTLAEDVVCNYVGATTDPKTGINALPATTDHILEGRNVVVAAIKFLETMTSVHHGHMPEIEITSPTTAKGIWAMVDILRFPPGDRVNEVVAYGHYHETYEKSGGKWRIKTLRLPRLLVDVKFAEQG